MESLGILSAEGDRRRVRFERHYDATAEELWNALVEPKQLSGWLGEALVESRAGGRYEITFDADDVALGVIRAFEPHRLLEYEWETEGDEASIVRFELRPEETGTTLVLDHRLLAATDAPSYGAGWHAHLELLDALLAGDRRAWQWERYRELLPSYEEQLAALSG